MDRLINHAQLPFGEGPGQVSLERTVELALFLKARGYRPRQVQDFIPAPMDIATAMYHTGLDPLTLEPVHVARGLRDRRLQRALLQFFKPENWFEVREALELAGRGDLIGSGPDALISEHPPREAVMARRDRAGKDEKGERRSVGYRPHRKGWGKGSRRKS